MCTSVSPWAQAALHSRWFAGNLIAAEFQFAAVYNRHFGI